MCFRTWHKIICILITYKIILTLIQNKMNCDSFNINDIIKHFLCCIPINVLDTFVPKHRINCLLDLKNQYEILSNTVNSDLIKKYPLKQSYQVAFLKWLMNKIENEGGDVCEDIYIVYCNLISSMLDKSVHYRHYMLADNCISIKESTNIISQGTTGLCTWQAAIKLSEWSIQNKNDFLGKTVLELGCGVGLTGLCIIKKCSPKEYIFTDGHEGVLDMVYENVEINLTCEKSEMPKVKNNRCRLQLKYNDSDVKAMKLKWEDIEKYMEEQVVPDIIIGADISYDRDLFCVLVKGLKFFLSFDNKYAIIASTIRNVNTFTRFLEELDNCGLYVEECPMPQQRIDMQFRHLFVRVLKIFQRRQHNFLDNNSLEEV